MSNFYFYDCAGEFLKMLNKISLENFKSFQHLEDLEIKPITILCGANSCGKSTVLQSLLLLKQTKESRNPSQSLLLNGNYVHMGAIKDIIHGNEDNELRIGYEYSVTSRQLFSGVRSRNRTPMNHVLRFLLRRGAGGLHSKHTINFSTNIKPSTQKKGYIQTADIDTYEFSISTETPDGEKIPGASVMIKKKDDEYSISWKNVHTQNHRENQMTIDGEIDGINVFFENFYPILDENPLPDDLDDSDEKRPRIPYIVRNMIRAMDDFLIGMNERITYVGPLRVAPSRRYIYENEVTQIGTKGENAAYIYQTELDNIISGHYFLEENKSVFRKKDSLKLKNALDHWLEIMNIKGFIPDFQSEIIRLKMNANSGSSMKVNIADVGFGVSQIFPILLEGLRMPQHGTLLLEQPEIHLHPKLQMQMADYFISLALSNKRVIVETHSDHVVNRLVRRILEDEDHQLNEKIGIYFVSNTGGGSQIERIKIDSKNGIVNWPEGFFDQTATEQENIILAGIKNRRKSTNNDNE